jgi:RNA polymerase sigma factor (sigma-70 family)
MEANQPLLASTGQGGDPGLVEVVAATDGIAMRRFARGLGLGYDQAEDCVQEALTRLWVQLDRGAPIADPKAWTYRVLYRIVMDEHRRRRRQVDAIGRAADAAADVSRVDPADLIATTHELDRLPSRRRQVLRLRYLAGMRYDEIGLTLGIETSAARSHATQAIEALRRRVLDPSATAVGGSLGRADALRPARRGWTESLGHLPSPPGGLLDPGGIDVDPAGRIWVVDAGHDAIAIYSAHGRYLERWSGPGTEPGRFSFHRALGNVGDIRFAADGGFYVADNGNRRIQRFDAERRFITAWGRRGRGSGEFLDPWSVRFDGQGRVYVSDAVRDDIQVFTPNGRHLRTIGRRGSGPGQLDFQGDAVVAGDRMYVADHANARIATYTTDGTFIRVTGLGHLRGPDGLDLGPDGNLHVADTTGRRFLVMSPDGAVLDTWPGQAWLLRALPDGRVLTSGRGQVGIHRWLPRPEILGDH